MSINKIGPGGSGRVNAASENAAPVGAGGGDEVVTAVPMGDVSQISPQAQTQARPDPYDYLPQVQQVQQAQQQAPRGRREIEVFTARTIDVYSGESPSQGPPQPVVAPQPTPQQVTPPPPVVTPPPPPITPQAVTPPPITPQQVPVQPVTPPPLPPLPQIFVGDEPLTLDTLGPLPGLDLPAGPLDLTPPGAPEVGLPAEPLDLLPPDAPEVGVPADPLELTPPDAPEVGVPAEPLDLTPPAAPEVELPAEPLTLDPQVTVPVKPEEPTEERPPERLGRRVTFRSIADPHLVTPDGARFDNHREGEFVLARSRAGDLAVQVRQGRMKGDTGIWQQAVALQAGSDRILYEATGDKLVVNGKAVPFKAGQRVALADGAYLELSRDRLQDGTPFRRVQLHTAQGDDLYALAFTRKKGGSYLDVRGDLAATRARGEVQGLAGTADGDALPATDLRLRDGKVTGDLAAFAEAWRVTPGERLFP